LPGIAILPSAASAFTATVDPTAPHVAVYRSNAVPPTGGVAQGMTSLDKTSLSRAAIERLAQDGYVR